MYEKLQTRIDELFENAPNTHRAKELKEELMANLIDKYNDLIAVGKEEDEAVACAIASVGDIDELIRGLRQYDVFDYEQVKKDREKSALIISVSIGIYIMSVVVLILASEVFGIDENIGVSLMLTMDAAATGLLVYNAMARPKYRKEDDTVVEEFKEWKSANNGRRKILQSVKSLIWTITLVLYFYISFRFMCWSYSWIIFLIGIAANQIVSLSFQIRRD